MKLPSALCCLIALPLFAHEPSRPGSDIAFEKVTLTQDFYSEGACFADFNKDGKFDVASGPFWYPGPDFKTKQEIYPVVPVEKNGVWYAGADFIPPNTPGKKASENYRSGPWDVDQYSDCFFTFSDDINRDGWVDVIVFGFPNKHATWYENPKNQPGHWKRHVVFDLLDNESPHFVDFDGNGTKDIVCSQLNRFGFASPDPADPTKPWKFTPISPVGSWHKFTHGLGVGDVNGDGKNDLLEKDGWWEQPADWKAGTGKLWTFHKFQFSEGGGAQMYAYDVDGDGDNDVLTSIQAHGYGYAWFEQVQKDKEISFVKHLIMGQKPEESQTKLTTTQLHAQDLIDMDGDGLKDVIIGKRKYAHGRKGDPEPAAAADLYWLKLVRQNASDSPGKAATRVEFIPHKIADDVGVGVMVQAGDVSGDGKPDVVVGCKLGTYVLIQKPAKH